MSVADVLPPSSSASASARPRCPWRSSGAGPSDPRGGRRTRPGAARTDASLARLSCLGGAGGGVCRLPRPGQWSKKRIPGNQISLWWDPTAAPLWRVSCRSVSQKILPEAWCSVRVGRSHRQTHAASVRLLRGGWPRPMPPRAVRGSRTRVAGRQCRATGHSTRCQDVHGSACSCGCQARPGRR